MAPRPRMRPVFEVPHPNPADVLVRLRELLADDEHCSGTVMRKHAVLRIRDHERHFWSPQLELEARTPDPDDEFAPDEPTLRGRFAPHPHVWTFFMAVYGLTLIGAIAGSMWGLSQWALDEPPWALGAVPLAMGFAAFVYGAVFIGQGLGAAQMYELRSLVDEAAENTESVTD